MEGQQLQREKKRCGEEKGEKGENRGDVEEDVEEREEEEIVKEASGVRTHDTRARGSENKGYSREGGILNGVSQEERGQSKGGMESWTMAANSCLRK